MTLFHSYATQRPKLVIHHMPRADEPRQMSVSPPPLAIQAPAPTVNPQLPHSQGPPAPPPPPGGWAGIIPSGSHSIRTRPPTRPGPMDGWKRKPTGDVIPVPAPTAPTPDPIPVPTIGTPSRHHPAFQGGDPEAV